MTVKLPRFHSYNKLNKTFTSEKLNKGGSPLLQPAWQIPDRLLLGATVSGSAHLSFGMSLPGTSAATMRLMSDLKTMKQSPPEGVSASPLNDENIYVWGGTVFGPDDTPWEGGIFSMRLTFTDQYPDKPPRVRFTSEMVRMHATAWPGMPCLWGGHGGHAGARRRPCARLGCPTPRTDSALANPALMPLLGPFAVPP